MKETIELLKSLRTVKDKHYDKLISNEALTRYTLIDPILYHIDWDLSNPAETVPEYRINNLPCDYALFKKDIALPYIIIETKSLNTKLVNKKQIGNYIANSTARYAIFTDGQKWKVMDFNVHPEHDPNERTVLDIDIFDEPINIVALKLYCLSKSNLLSDNAIFLNNEKKEGRTTSKTEDVDSSVSETDNENKQNQYNEKTRGRDHLEDYIIPAVIKIKHGSVHTEVFKIIASNLDVSYQTVNARCTRDLKINTNKFLSLINNGEIVNFLKRKFPFKEKIIDNKLNY